MKKGFVALVLVATIIGVTLVVASATSLEDYMSAITSAGDRLTALQNPSDFGWEWVVPDTSSGNTGGTSFHNLYGVTGIGLLGAGLVSKGSPYYQAANKALQHIQENCPDEGDLYNNAWAYADTHLSMVLASGLGVHDYLDYITKQWEWTKAHVAKYHSGNLEQAYQAAYNHVAGWDAAYGVGTQAGYALWNTARYGIAAVSLNDLSWARELAEVIKNHLDEPNPATGWFYALGWGQSLAFLEMLDPVTYADEIASLVSKLKLSQAGDGSWEGSDIQATSYALLGLAVADINSPAGQKAAEWLLSQQNPNGGWSAWASSEYPEVDSEALQGIISYQIGIYLSHASGLGVDKPLALEILKQAGLVNGYSLLPYASLGLHSLKDILVAMSLTNLYGLTPKDAVQIVHNFGGTRVSWALITSRLSYEKFMIRLLGYGFPCTKNGKALDKEDDTGVQINGVDLKAVYRRGEEIKILFGLCNPLTKRLIADAVVTLSVVKVDSGERPIFLSWEIIPFDKALQMYTLNYATLGLAPGYYDFFIGPDDGHIHQFRIQVIAP